MHFNLHCKYPQGKSAYRAILENRLSCPVFFAESKEELLTKALAWCAGEETQKCYVNKRVLQYDYDPEAMPDFMLEIDVEDFCPPATMPAHTPCWLLDCDYENMKSQEKSLASGECWEGPTGHYHSWKDKEGLEKLRLTWLESSKKK